MDDSFPAMMFRRGWLKERIEDRIHENFIDSYKSFSRQILQIIVLSEESEQDGTLTQRNMSSIHKNHKNLIHYHNIVIADQHHYFHDKHRMQF